MESLKTLKQELQNLPSEGCGPRISPAPNPTPSTSTFHTPPSFIHTTITYL